MSEKFLNLNMLYQGAVANDSQIFCGVMDVLQKGLKLFEKGCSTRGRWSVNVQKVERFLIQRYFDEKIFKGGADHCRNTGCIQSVSNQKPQSSSTAGFSRLLIQTVAWWGEFGKIGACGVRSYPGL